LRNRESESQIRYIIVSFTTVSEDYKIIISIRQSTSDLILTMIINRILKENSKIYDIEGREAKVTLVSKVLGKPKLVLRCTNCSKDRLMDLNCWKKHPGQHTKSGGFIRVIKGKRKGNKDLEFTISAATSLKTIVSLYWYLDSVTTEYFSPFRGKFETFKDLESLIAIVIAQSVTYETGIGYISITVLANNRVYILQLNNVIYVLDMDTNLLSVDTLFDLGYEISIKPNKGKSIYKSDMLVMSIIRNGKLFYLKSI
jgi:Pol polyprotein, beta-barrel domain